MEEKLFSDKNALEMSLLWARSVSKAGAEGVFDTEDCACEIYRSQNRHKFESETVLFCFNDNMDMVKKYSGDYEVFSKDEWNVRMLFEQMAVLGEQKKAENIVFAFADQPFLNSEIAQQVIFTGIEYKAEYVFADGYPYGLSCEFLSKDTAAILAQLAASTYEDQGLKPVAPSSIFDFLKLDINSFDVETVISPKDFRLFRLKLDCSSKANAMGCKAVFDSKANELSPVEMCEKICMDVNVIKTLPVFYEIAVTDKVNVKSVYVPESMESISGSNFMPKKKFFSLIEKIKSFSSSGVISLSAFAESTLHPLFFDFAQKVLEQEGFSLLVETDGFCINQEFCAKLKSIYDSCKSKSGFGGFEKILLIVKVDGISKNVYQTIHGDGNGFDFAVQAVSLLSKDFPDMVYPQLVRMDLNEMELEAFYRYWSDKASPSSGNLIIQKYNGYCQVLPSRKPADLSPIDRNPCWHLRRDFVVLSDGSVPLCKSQFDNIIGNAFDQPIFEIWKKMDDELVSHMKEKYCEKCGKCDEFYTYNF